MRLRPAAIAVLFLMPGVQFGDGRTRDAGTRHELRRAVESVRHLRPIEGRLTGGFAHAAWRGPVPVPAETERVLLATAFPFLSRSADARPSDEAATATIQLLLGRTGTAVKQLERAIAIAADDAAPEWESDLSAAYLARADDAQQFGDAVRALALAERALARAPTLIEAWFNRALAMTRLYLPTADMGWTDYLTKDNSSAYAAEARSRLASVREHSKSPTQDGMIVGELTGAELQPHFDWADAVVANGPADQNRALQSAEARAAFMAARSDRFHERVLRDVQQANGSVQVRMASGVQALARGYEALGNDDISDAGRHFKDAARRFTKASAVLADLAEYRLAVTDYYAGRIDEALARTTAVANRARVGEYLVLRSRALRLKGLIEATRARYDTALRSYSDAIEASRRAGAVSHTAALHNQLSEVMDYLGQRNTAWEFRGKALADLRHVVDPGQRQSILVLSALAALEQGLPEAADHFVTATEATARGAGNALDRSEAAILRLRVERALARDDRAARALDEAKRAAAVIADPQLRAKTAAELALADARAYATTTAVDEALDYFSATDALSRLTEVYAARARQRLVGGDHSAAAAELTRALDTFDRRARSLGDEERRLTHDATGRPLFEASIELATSGGDAWAALAALERYHDRFDADSALRGDELASVVRTETAKSGAALVAYASLPDRFLAWIVAPSGRVETISRPISRPRLKAMVDGFNDAILQNEISRATQAGAELFELLLASAAGTEARRLWLVPDGPLHRLPFGALVEPSTGQLAVQRWEIALRPSLAGGRSRSTARQANGVLVVGNPATPEGSALDAAAHEANDVAGLYPGAAVLTGRAATRNGIERALGNAAVVHFGGHAVINPDHPLLSRLLLASDEAGNPGDLFVYDLQRLDLRHVRLAVLAACRSADSSTPVADGVISIASVLLARGVRSVVASLFDLGDAGARELFVRFHREFSRTNDAAASLRAAQLDLAKRRDVRMRDWAGVLSIDGSINSVEEAKRR